MLLVVAGRRYMLLVVAGRGIYVGDCGWEGGYMLLVVAGRGLNVVSCVREGGICCWLYLGGMYMLLVVAGKGGYMLLVVAGRGVNVVGCGGAGRALEGGGGDSWFLNWAIKGNLTKNSRPDGIQKTEWSRKLLQAAVHWAHPQNK
jgi:hypothetical protein